ncbi:MAG: hypothetical protein HDT43_04520 [Ruminococcaceae bacterium]|nr:hypothetical protein [Oscillospiraceae bacterium]
MIVKKSIDVSQPLTEEQIKMLEALKDRSIVFDEDCPELTEEELSQFERVSGDRLSTAVRREAI